MNQTRFEKYSVAVRSKMKRCIAGSATAKKKGRHGALTDVVATFVDVQGQGAHSNANHGFQVIEELDRFHVQRELVVSLKRNRDEQDWRRDTAVPRCRRS